MKPQTNNSPIYRNNNSLIIAYDHGLEHGPSDFEQNPESQNPEKIFEIAQHSAVTALATQKGIAEAYAHEYPDTNLLVKLNGTSNMWQPDNPKSQLNCSVKYAAKELNADAVGYTMYAGSKYEDRMAEKFRKIQEEARKHGLPVVMWAYPRGQGIEQNPKYSDDTDPEAIKYAARIGLELGADMVKVKHPRSRETLKQIAKITGKTKVVMSGGSKTEEDQFIKSVKQVMDSGGNGLAVGRNVFQRRNPSKLLDRLEQTIFRQ